MFFSLKVKMDCCIFLQHLKHWKENTKTFQKRLEEFDTQMLFWSSWMLRATITARPSRPVMVILFRVKQAAGHRCLDPPFVAIKFGVLPCIRYRFSICLVLLHTFTTFYHLGRYFEGPWVVLFWSIVAFGGWGWASLVHFKWQPGNL